MLLRSDETNIRTVKTKLAWKLAVARKRRYIMIEPGSLDGDLPFEGIETCGPKGSTYPYGKAVSSITRNDLAISID